MRKNRTLSQQFVQRTWRKKNVNPLIGRFTHVRIYSMQWGSWWRHGGAGYTQNKEEAGIYTVEEAWANTSHCGREKGIIYYEVSGRIGFTPTQSELIDKLSKVLRACVDAGLRFGIEMPDVHALLEITSTSSGKSVSAYMEFNGSNVK